MHTIALQAVLRHANNEAEPAEAAAAARLLAAYVSHKSTRSQHKVRISTHSFAATFRGCWPRLPAALRCKLQEPHPDGLGLSLQDDMMAALAPRLERLFDRGDVIEHMFYVAPEAQVGASHVCSASGKQSFGILLLVA